MIHHDKSEYPCHSTIYGRVTMVTTYCGKTSIKGEEVPADQQTPEEQRAMASPDHCLRCLYGKRRQKGDAHMLEHGYPLVKRHRSPENFYSWRLVIEEPAP